METQAFAKSPEISDTVRVRNAHEISELLRDFMVRETPVIPIGGGTSMHTGNDTTETYIGLDMRGISGVREYHPTDLTASFHAGTTLLEVRETLAEHGQELPVDLVAPDTATIGGMVATGFAGPRRLGSGTLKDLIIGAEYVRGDGLMAKAGGMLVKNVSGFEIPRFLHGSWGALAVITAINLKVLPKQKADVSFTHLERSLESSLDGQLSLLRHHPGVAALVTTPHEDDWAMSARIVGGKSSVDAQIEGFRNDLGADTVVSEGDGIWAEHNLRWARDDGTVRLLIGGRSRVIRALALDLAQRDGRVDLAISLGTGTLRVAFAPDALSRRDVAAYLASHNVTWTIESAPARWKDSASVWGPRRSDMALSVSIKQQFDPANILNRGRLFV